MTAEEKRARRIRPLTDTEAQFAEAHMGIIFWYLSRRQLPFDEWFDVVVIRYLEAVKRWHEDEALRARYSFTTIAVGAMRSSVHNEFRAQRRRIQTVSLYDTVPGTDSLTWADVV